jgi:multidrug efflux pump subunit AcrA (membrane-fusion protein)
MTKCILNLAFVLLMMVSCNKKQEQTKPVEEKITSSVYASGIIKTVNQYQVFSTVNGLVAEKFVTEGDVVKKGSSILRISNSTVHLNEDNAKINADYTLTQSNLEKLNELQTNIDVAKSKMDNDVLLLQRQKNLWKEQIGSQNEVEQRELSLKSSTNIYEAAKLKYTQLQKQINFQEKQSQKTLEISKNIVGDYTIKSELDGKVYNILKEKGEMVNSQTAVALIGDANIFLLELQVDEYDIAKIKLGQKILITMDSYKGKVFDAVVSKINPIMNERSKSFTIEAIFVKQPEALYPNLTCEANILIQEKEKALTIPRNYLLSGDSVILSNKEKKKVITGLKDYQKVEIVSGLSVNDVIYKPAP